MIVQELIDKLSQYPPDLPVIIRVVGVGCANPSVSVEKFGEQNAVEFLVHFSPLHAIESLKDFISTRPES